MTQLPVSCDEIRTNFAQSKSTLAPLVVTFGRRVLGPSLGDISEVYRRFEGTLGFSTPTAYAPKFLQNSCLTPPLRS